MGRRLLIGLTLVTASSLATLAFAMQKAPVRDPGAPPPPDVAVSAVVQDSTAVAALTVTPGAKPPQVGSGAPLYAVQDLKDAAKQAVKLQNESRSNANMCQDGVLASFDPGGTPTLEHFYRELFLAAQKLNTLADRAAKASEDAAAARTAAAGNPGDAAKQHESEDAEIRRQSAVNNFIVARKAVSEARAEVGDLMELMHNDENEEEGQAKTDRQQAYRSAINERRMERDQLGGVEGVLLAPEYFDMKVTDVTAQSMTDGKGAYIHVTGIIHNTRPKATNIPPISLSAIDGVGYTLATYVADSGKQQMQPGQAIKFAYDFRPSPGRVARMFVTFANDNFKAMQMAPSYFCQPNTDISVGGAKRGGAGSAGNGRSRAR